MCGGDGGGDGSGDDKEQLALDPLLLDPECFNSQGSSRREHPLTAGIAATITASRARIATLRHPEGSSF